MVWPTLPRAVCDNSHRDRAGWGHDPRDNPRFRRMGSTSRCQTANCRWDWNFLVSRFPRLVQVFDIFSACRATSHLEHGIGSWHDAVLCMIVFVFAGAGCKPRLRTGTGPTTQTTGGRRRRVLMRRYITATEAPSATDLLSAQQPIQCKYNSTACDKSAKIAAFCLVACWGT